MRAKYSPAVDRASKVSATRQIYQGLREAILSGSLSPGAKLSSWQDLASQLGVSRGTVRRAYDLLKDEQLIVARGAAGTRVRSALPSAPQAISEGGLKLPGMFYDFEAPPQYFQMGIPAQDEFPLKAWNVAWRKALSLELSRPAIYPDPRGLGALRQEIAGYLAAARGVACHTDRIFITAGFSAALGIVLNVMGFRGQRALMEEPGYPRTRQALLELDIAPVPVPVDQFGAFIPPQLKEAGAALAIVTPGQQAPLGMPLSSERRTQLLDWARETNGWIIEDDYAGELQLSGKAMPALAAEDEDGRVFHIGSFSKTINPGLRLGYLVVPEKLAVRFGSYAGHLAPAGASITQQAVQIFLSGGHYLRHLRKMKKLYLERKMLLVSALREELHPDIGCEHDGGLSVRLFLPAGSDDRAIAEKTHLAGLGAMPISTWYQQPNPPRGLLLGIANIDPRTVVSHSRALSEIISAMV